MATLKDLNKVTLSLAKSAGTLQEKIQSHAVNCLAHAREHGDASALLFLCQQLPKGQRVQALKLWAQAFSPIKLQTDTNGDFVGVKIAAEKSKLYVAWDLDAAAANPYYSFTKENAPAILSLEAIEKMVLGLAKRYDKAADEGRIAEGEAELIQRRIAVLTAAVKSPLLTVAVAAEAAA